MGKDVKHFRAYIGLGTMAPRVIRSSPPSLACHSGVSLENA